MLRTNEIFGELGEISYSTLQQTTALAPLYPNDHRTLALYACAVKKNMCLDKTICDDVPEEERMAAARRIS